MLKFALAFLLCGLLVSTLTAADQNSLVDVRSEEEALQGAFIEDDGAEIGQPLKRAKEGVKAIPVLDANKEELQTITEKIWAVDKNSFPESDVVYNVRGPKYGRFFTTVNEERFNKVETYAKMIALFKCYDELTVGMDCRNKEKEFHKEILDTPPIKAVREWVLKKDKYFGFSDELWQYWFTRNALFLGSTGFKHTFVGGIGQNAKTREDEVKGLHNWVRMFFEEKAKRLVYKGFRGSCPSVDESAFMRTSPEVEIALYTICLLTHRDKACHIQLNGIPLTISVFADRVEENISSAFPIC